MSERLEDTLRRLKWERDEADRRYNDALTAVDRSLTAPVALPAAPPPYDETQITPLNEAWNIIPGPPQARGLKWRFAAPIWRVVAPYFHRQLTFNSKVVDHLNRNAAAHREAHRAADKTIAALQQHFSEQVEFQARLMALLQEITLYVDTKDRDTAGGALVLNASQSALADAAAKQWESARTHLTHLERDLKSRVGTLEQAYPDITATLAVLQQATQTLKREIERNIQGSEGAPRSPGSPGSQDAFAPALDAYKYVAFEDRFRGSRELIRGRFESYVPLFEGASDVLDVGCGRGEFLDLLASRGIRARGVDLNHEMAEQCRARGLDVTEADAVGYLTTLEDASIGGLFAAQVVEHLQPGYLLRFLELAFHKLRPGGRLVLETLNPACWVAFFESYIRDITHVLPLHPDTLKYLVVASGFTSAAVEFRSPVPPEQRLQPVVLPAGAQPAVVDLAAAFNASVERLNAWMFSYMDYAVVAGR